MDNIMNKIAEILQVSVEKAIELYPQLRTEAVLYSVTVNLLYALGSALTISLFASFFLWMESNSREGEQNKKRCKRFLQLSSALGLLILLIAIVSPFLYPNIIFFKQFIK